MSRKPFELESNVDKITKQIQDMPYKVFQILGKNLTREIRTTTIKNNYHKRAPMLSKSLQYWARKKEGDLQIGFKMSIEKNEYGVGPGIVGGIMDGSEPDPIKEVVVKNKDLIVDEIAKALQEIGKR